MYNMWVQVYNRWVRRAAPRLLAERHATVANCGRLPTRTCLQAQKNCCVHTLHIYLPTGSGLRPGH